MLGNSPPLPNSRSPPNKLAGPCPTAGCPPGPDDPGRPEEEPGAAAEMEGREGRPSTPGVGGPGAPERVSSCWRRRTISSCRRLFSSCRLFGRKSEVSASSGEKGRPKEAKSTNDNSRSLVLVVLALEIVGHGTHGVEFVGVVVDCELE